MSLSWDRLSVFPVDSLAATGVMLDGRNASNGRMCKWLEWKVQVLSTPPSKVGPLRSRDILLTHFQYKQPWAHAFSHKTTQWRPHPKSDSSSSLLSLLKYLTQNSYRRFSMRYQPILQSPHVTRLIRYSLGTKSKNLLGNCYDR